MSDVEPDELQSATERLVDQVAALAGALQSIGKLQEQQQELASQVKAVKEDVAENAVPKHEFVEAQKNTADERAKLQLRIRKFAIGISILALIASGVSSYIAISVAQGQRVALCHERNREAASNSAKSKVYFAPYVRQEQAYQRTHPDADPTLAAILFSIADTPPQVLKCE